ncbi:hypothetical protein EI546_10610 [Aequorivita sp. H23M31]|uniref:NlpE C-terminal OB domain-containing protein n=1 Tax=Aequorivita ciconiae TaxID=2494375 RepID=A0A410G4J7_9FLAO|nr:hypothetical protein [Aequorivita sp. H23M31]QAA82145.1 hypothetical protein EI546_10610 [Aequorivita sp. H23M31]
MKKTLLLFLFTAILISCKDNKAEIEEPDANTPVVDSTLTETYQGEFIYTPDASVFKGRSYVYGVEMNDLAKELGKKVEAVKKSDYDMVPVIVRGEVNKKPEETEGWDEILTITEIINVSDTPTKADVELKANKS